MTKLSKYEKETIINWNEAEDTASIYTFNADLKRRLAEFSRKYPQLCRLERSTPEGSVTYVMDKSRLSIRLVPPYSEERLAAAREYAKQHGFQVLRTDRTARSGWLLPESTPNSTDFRFCGRTRRAPEIRSIHGGMTGLHPIFLR